MTQNRVGPGNRKGLEKDVAQKRGWPRKQNTPNTALARRPHGTCYRVGYDWQVAHQTPDHQHSDASLLVDIIQPAVIQNQRNQPSAHVRKNEAATEPWKPVRRMYFGQWVHKCDENPPSNTIREQKKSRRQRRYPSPSGTKQFAREN